MAKDSLELNAKVAEFVREKRIEKGLSQADLALLVFGSKETRQRICALENGAKQITVETLGRILYELNYTISFVENNKTA